MSYLNYLRTQYKSKAMSVLDGIGGKPQGDRKKGEGKSLIYPEDLFSPECAPFILFFSVDPIQREKIIDKIALYMPRSIGVHYGISFSEYDNIVAQITNGAANLYDQLQKATYAQAMNPGNPLAGIASIIQDNPGTATNLGSGLAVGTITSLVASLFTKNKLGIFTAGAIAGGQTLKLNKGNLIGQAASFQSKKIWNPHTTAMFQGVKLRRHNFNFEFAARNEGESDTIKEIIECFKYNAHPEAVSQDGTDSFLYYPNNFHIALYSPARKYLYNISTCFLEDIQVDYTPEGNRAFFAGTGAPVSVRLSLQFVETELLTRSRIRQGS